MDALEIKNKKYIIREYWRNYMPGMGNDYFVKHYYYTSFELCDEHSNYAMNIF